MEGWLPEAAASEVEVHVAACARCTRELDQWRDLDRALWRQPRAEPPRGFRDAVMARIGEEQPEDVPWRERWIPMILAAAAALLLLITGSILEHATPAVKETVGRGRELANWAGDSAQVAVKTTLERGLGRDTWALSAASSIGIPANAISWVGLAGLVVMLGLLRPYWMGRKRIES
jgi:anti-sigma factor RsiW